MSYIVKYKLHSLKRTQSGKQTSRRLHISYSVAVNDLAVYQIFKIKRT